MDSKIVMGLGLIIVVLVAVGAYYYGVSTSSNIEYVTVTSTATETITITSTITETLASVSGELSAIEVEAIKYMVEEEKLAYDVYTRLAEMYPDVPVFANIAKSEATHVSAVLALADKYGIEVTLREPGVFDNEHIQELYNQLIEKGSQSLKDALEVGATIEEVDIVDLKDWVSKVSHDDIKQVFECLMMGSRNHLRAFTGTLKNLYGVEYTPQYISEEEYQQIISTPMEIGGACRDLGIDVGANITAPQGPVNRPW